MSNTKTRAALTAACVCAIAGFGIYSQQPPVPVPAGASPVEFSSARAMAHLRTIASRPHPIGSEANRDVRDYIVRQLTLLGLEPQVQRATGIRESARGGVVIGTVENIVVRLRGSSPGKAVMVAAHYDSVPTSPGASDDGHAVAVILETLRALRHGPGLRNDLIALFTDGEETGMLGAEAFTSQHPWAKDVAVALNFEGRGIGGPALMFETSSANGWLIRNFAKAAPSPVSTSLFYEFYRRMPNDTDLTVFKKSGMAGMNFAFVDGSVFYHTPKDDVAHISERSVQQQGTYALSLARQFGNQPLDQTKAANVIWFNLAGLGLVAYPEWAAVVLGLLGAAALGWLLFRGLLTKRLSASGIAAGAGALLITSAAAALATAGIWRLLRAIYGSRFVYGADPYRTLPYELGFVLFATAVATAVYSAAARKWRAADLMAGALAVWCLLAIVSALLLPGGSFLFTWPLLFGVASFALATFAGKRRWVAVMNEDLAILAVPALLMWAPMLVLLWSASGLSMSWMVAAGVALLFGLLMPQTGLAATAWRWRMPAVCAVAALLAFVYAGAGPAFDKEHPRPDSIFYWLSADEGQAVWASWDDAPDEWTSQFLGARPKLSRLPGGSRDGAEFLTHDAPRHSIEPPLLRLLDDRTAGGARALTIHAASPRGAQTMALTVEADVRAIEAGGRTCGATRAGRIRLTGLPKEGIEFKLSAPAGTPVRLVAYDISTGLPSAGVSVRERPEWMMAAPRPYSDSTLVSKTYTF